jgi:hypothetical protein
MDDGALVGAGQIHCGQILITNPTKHSADPVLQVSCKRAIWGNKCATN